jgi:lipid II:glycine glycyltransferase (peptidoglycan interpeptide bridge formation enzyme)
MNVSVCVDRCGPQEWDRILATFSDASLFQCSQYGETRWGASNLSRLVVYGHDGLPISAAQLRIMKVPLLGVGIAYIRYGPVWKRGSAGDIDNFRAGLRALVDEYVVKRRLFLRIRPFGFEDTDSEMKRALELEGFSATRGIYRDKRQTILVDLDPTEEQLRRRLHKKWRYSLKQAETANLQVREYFDTSKFHELDVLYQEMMLRKRFRPGSTVSEYARLQAQLPETNRLRVTTCVVDGAAVAGSACSAMGDTVIALLGSSGGVGRKLNAYYLLQWDEILWAKRAGKRVYDLNGINAVTNPGVYHFKAGLGGREVTFLEVYDRCNNRILYQAILTFEALLRLRSTLTSQLKRSVNRLLANSRALPATFERVSK